jgi:dTDP-4-dehydrorhamnose reductase
MRQIVLIGAGGQLGSDLRGLLSRRDGDRLIPLTHADLDVCDQAKVRERLSQIRPDVVLNTAAYHRVDDCEDQAEKTFQVNALAVLNLARVCRDLGALLVHFSTDYVFGGDLSRCEPLPEDAPPHPVSVYGASKLAGEYLARSTCPRHFVVRSCGLYGVAGSSGKGGNFVELMLRLAREGKPIRVVDDQRVSPTFTADLAAKVVELLDSPRYGLYHITNSGDCSWYEFAVEIFRQTGLTPDLSRTTSEAFGAKARRPRYSVLANRGLEEAGLKPMRSWREALSTYLELKGHKGKTSGGSA